MPKNPLLTAPNIVITLHLVWAARQARQRLMRTSAENVRAFLYGRPQNLVNGNWLGREPGFFCRPFSCYIAQN